MRWTGHVARRSLPALLAGLSLGWAAGCIGDGNPEDGRRGTGQCPALTYEEQREVCNEALTRCLHTHIQGISSGRKKHSHCMACADRCMQQQGVWPAKYLGKPCL
jgi:hypothetical protein